MTSETNFQKGRGINLWRVAGWGLAGLLLLLPLVAMQFTNEVNWTASDFVFAAILFGTVGAVLELAVRITRNSAYRAGVGLAAAAAFLIVWASGAVGMIGNEDDAYNLLFIAVIVVAVVGSALARLRASGMAKVMGAAALLHAAAALGGMASDLRGGIFSLVFAGLWLLSAAAFAKAARDEGAGKD
jgi:hypothetical protein